MTATTEPREKRRSAYSRGYTKAWSKASHAFRLRYPLCGMRPDDQPAVMSLCQQQARSTPATLTDHVIPHRGDPLLFWDERFNWQALCKDCHDRKSRYEGATDVEMRA